MKKILFVFIALICSISVAVAQGPINRTNKTIVADVLAQLPISDQVTYNTLFADLASTGEEGITMLAQLLDDTDASSRVAAEYALGGLAAYISGQKDENLCSNIVLIYHKAMGMVSDEVKKNFLKRQINLMGGTETIEGEAIAAPAVEAGLVTDNPVKEVLSALNKTDKIERNRVLNLASRSADDKMYVEVIQAIRKAKADVKVDVLNWIGREASSDPAKKIILKNLEIKPGQPARLALVKFVEERPVEVKEAAVWALTRIGDPENIPVIANLLTSTDEEVVALAKNALASYPGDISASVVKVIDQAGAVGKTAGLELLALRKSDVNSTTVYKLTEADSQVKEAAYKALKDVVKPVDFVRLSGMLEAADDAGVIASLQEATIASVASLPPVEQFAAVNERMAQAGTAKRYLYYKVLAGTEDPRALTIIYDGFNNGEGEAKDQAFDALLCWKGSEAKDILYAVAKDPSSSTYSERALNAYIHLAASPEMTGENRLIGLRKAMEIAQTPQQKNNILNRIRQANTFTAMIYAGRFLDDEQVKEAAAQAVMNIALNNSGFTGTEVRRLLEKTASVLNNPDVDYQRQAINKHLAEMPQEEGFVSIFNGKDLTGWKGLVGNPLTRAKMNAAQMKSAQEKADEQMRKDWKVENGLLLFDGSGYDNLCTEKKYGDIEMYIDWMLDPSGKEADAGIYLRGTPQVQIWDIARVNVGAQVGSGGLYNNQTHPSHPAKVADNKMGEWNTFYIKMTGDRVTVILNGEKVVDDVILENYWDRQQPIPAIEQLELQAHGSKVYYRDIYIKELSASEPFRLSAEEQKEGYKILFDGTHMHSWIGNLTDYTMDNGAISLVPSRGSGGNLYTKDEYGNFIFRFEFQLTPAANNGLGIRTPLTGDAAYVGMELQILDDDHPVYKDLEAYQYHGSVYGIIPARRGALKPVGEWNYEEVIANGDNIKITLNGEVIVDGNIREATKNGTSDKKEHPGLFNKKGHIGFLGHGSPVKFRNIRIKELK